MLQGWGQGVYEKQLPSVWGTAPLAALWKMFSG